MIDLVGKPLRDPLPDLSVIKAPAHENIANIRPETTGRDDHSQPSAKRLVRQIPLLAPQPVPIVAATPPAPQLAPSPGEPSPVAKAAAPPPQETAIPAAPISARPQSAPKPRTTGALKPLPPPESARVPFQAYYPAVNTALPALPASPLNKEPELPGGIEASKPVAAVSPQKTVDSKPQSGHIAAKAQIPGNDHRNDHSASEPPRGKQASKPLLVATPSDPAPALAKPEADAGASAVKPTEKAAERTNARSKHSVPMIKLPPQPPPSWETERLLTEDDFDSDLFTAAIGARNGNAPSPRSMSKEWELPRVKRRAGRPALESAIVPVPSGLPSTRVSYIVRTQTVAQVLREIGQLTGTRIVVGSGVKSTLRERHLEGPANAVFDKLSREFGLFWFSDGGVVYVDPAEESKTKFFRVRNASAGSIEDALASAGLATHRDRVQIVGSDGLVRATGPESFHRSVEAILTGMETERGSVHLIKFGQKAN